MCLHCLNGVHLIDGIPLMETEVENGLGEILEPSIYQWSADTNKRFVSVRIWVTANFEFSIIVYIFAASLIRY